MKCDDCENEAVMRYVRHEHNPPRVGVTFSKDLHVPSLSDSPPWRLVVRSACADHAKAFEVVDK